MKNQTAPPTTVERRKRRWLTLSLRALLIITLLFGIAFAWIAKTMREARAERAALAQITLEVKQHGGDVMAVNDGPNAPAHGAFVGWLEGWFGEGSLTGVRQLTLDGLVTDGALEHIASLPNLKELWFNNAELADNGLRPLKALHHLEILDIDVLSETPTDLEFLDTMPHLRYLGLSWLQPTDAGWDRIQRLPALKQLSLRGMWSDGNAGMPKVPPGCKVGTDLNPYL